MRAHGRVVGVAEHETREHEEEVDGEVAVVHHLVDGRCGEAFEKVIPYYKDGSHTSEAVEKLVAGALRRDVGLCIVAHG